MNEVWCIFTRFEYQSGTSSCFIREFRNRSSCCLFSMEEKNMKIGCTVYFHVSKATDTLNIRLHINPQISKISAHIVHKYPLNKI